MKMKTGPHSRRRHWTCIIALLPPALSPKRKENMFFLETTTAKIQLFILFEHLTVICKTAYRTCSNKERSRERDDRKHDLN